MSKVSVDVESSIEAPASRVSRYLSDFENACEWMVGIKDISRTSGANYRLIIDTPIGRLRPEAEVVETRPDFIRWVYTSAVAGEGEVNVMETDFGCMVRYRGDFEVSGRILGRAAKAAGMEGFARRQGERSLERLRQLMEARRNG